MCLPQKHGRATKACECEFGFKWLWVKCQCMLVQAVVCACVHVSVYRQTTFKKSSEVWKTCFLRCARDGNRECLKKNKWEPRTREHPPPQFHTAFTKKKYIPSCSQVWMNSGRFAQVQKICYWATAEVFVPVITCNRKQHVYWCSKPEVLKYCKHQ